eukprot:11641678-Alexandrium_andersonii.AAC.1
MQACVLVKQSNRLNFVASEVKLLRTVEVAAWPTSARAAWRKALRADAGVGLLAGLDDAQRRGQSWQRFHVSLKLQAGQFAKRARAATTEAINAKRKKLSERLNVKGRGLGS